MCKIKPHNRLILIQLKDFISEKSEIEFENNTKIYYACLIVESRTIYRDFEKSLLNLIKCFYKNIQICIQKYNNEDFRKIVKKTIEDTFDTKYKCNSENFTQYLQKYMDLAKQESFDKINKLVSDYNLDDLVHSCIKINYFHSQTLRVINRDI